MRVWLDPEKLASRNMTASDVVKALREQNVQVAAGRIGQPPVPTGIEFQYTINTLGRLLEPEQFGEIVVKTGETRPSDAATRRRPGSSSAPRTTTSTATSTASRLQCLPSSSCPAPTPWTRPRASGPRWSVEGALSRRGRLPHRLRHDGLRRRVDPRGLQDALRGVHPGVHRRAGVPAELAGDDPPDDRRAGVADRHVRASWRCWASR